MKRHIVHGFLRGNLTWSSSNDTSDDPKLKYILKIDTLSTLKFCIKFAMLLFIVSVIFCTVDSSLMIAGLLPVLQL